MVKPRHAKGETPRDMRQKKLFWRTAGVMSIALIFLAGSYYLLTNRHEKAPGDENHPHERAAHGGVIVSLGGDNHYHVEIVLLRGGILKLYMLGEDATRVVEVESQFVKALVKPGGAAAATAVALMPMPQPCDRPGKTSQFMAKLPEEWAGNLVVNVPKIVVGRVSYAFEFKTSGFTHDENLNGKGQDRERLYLTPDGKYTEADIKANGNHSAPQKFKAFRPNHDAAPQPGDRICPVSRMKASFECTWIVSGKTYAFCCPPCIDEFVRRAKTQPDLIQEPEKYEKK